MPTDMTDAHFETAPAGDALAHLDAWERARPEYDQIEGWVAKTVAYLAGLLIVAACLVGSAAQVLDLPLAKAIWAAAGLGLSSVLYWLRKA